MGVSSGHLSETKRIGVQVDRPLQCEVCVVENLEVVASELTDEFSVVNVQHKIRCIFNREGLVNPIHALVDDIAAKHRPVNDSNLLKEKGEVHFSVERFSH